jgi:Intracellular proteinase inhibitor
MRFANSDAADYTSAMNFRLPVFAFLALACLPLHAETFPGEEGKKKPAPGVVQEGWLKRTGKALWPFGKKPGDAAVAPLPKGSQSGKEWKNLVPTISIAPMPLKLSDVRTMTVTLQLANKGKKLAQLDFPTTQRIEVLVKDSTGKMIEQWSEDQAFENEPTLVAINPAERLEYTATVATRELKAGQTYTIEGFFPNFEQLRATKQITPLP